MLSLGESRMKIKYHAAFAVCLMTTASFSQTTINPASAISGDDPDGTLSAFGDAYGAGSDTWRRWLFVGAPRETTLRDGLDQQDGAVYIYRRDAGGAYVFSQKLTMPGSSGLTGGGGSVNGSPAKNAARTSGNDMSSDAPSNQNWARVGTA